MLTGNIFHIREGAIIQMRGSAKYWMKTGNEMGDRGIVDLASGYYIALEDLEKAGLSPFVTNVIAINLEQFITEEDNL